MPLDQLEVRCGSKRRIGYHEQQIRPRRPPKADQHPAEQPLLGPLAWGLLTAHNLGVHRNPVISPVEHHHDDMESKDVGA
jgi:hypothetical protein